MTPIQTIHGFRALGNGIPNNRKQQIPRFQKASETFFTKNDYDTDFRLLIKDAYRPENRWSHEDFPWQGVVWHNLRYNLNNLPPDQLKRVMVMALSVTDDFPRTELQRLQQEGLPTDPDKLGLLKLKVVKRQFKALHDFAAHVTIAERSSISPLGTSSTIYQKYPDAQEAGTLFVADEGRHASVMEQYLIEETGGKRHTDEAVVSQFGWFRWVAMKRPKSAAFLALSVETVGSAAFEYMAKHCPEPLMRQISETIAYKDELRHVAIAGSAYRMLNGHKRPETVDLSAMQKQMSPRMLEEMTEAGITLECFPTDFSKLPFKARILPNDFFLHFYKAFSTSQTRLETLRNHLLMKLIIRMYKSQLKSDVPMMQSLTALGIDTKDFVAYTGKRIQQEFGRIGYTVTDDMIPTPQ